MYVVDAFLEKARFKEILDRLDHIRPPESNRTKRTRTRAEQGTPIQPRRNQPETQAQEAQHALCRTFCANKHLGTLGKDDLLEEPKKHFAGKGMDDNELLGPRALHWVR